MLPHSDGLEPSRAWRARLKNSNDVVGNRTRDLPACSAVPQPTAQPCALNKEVRERKYPDRNRDQGLAVLRTVTIIRFDKKERKFLAAAGTTGFCTEFNRLRGDHENVS